MKCSIVLQIILGFSVLSCAFSAMAQDGDLSPAEATSTPEKKSLVAIIEISKNRIIRGTVEDFDRLNVETNFGNATFSMQEIEGIKFGLDDKGSCLFAFSNGDTVTAKLKLDSISVATDWGDANIKTSKIVSIRMNENGSFYSDNSVAGKPRWRYSSARPSSAGNFQQPFNSTTIFGNN